MKFKDYFIDVLNQTKSKLQSAEAEELELLRKLEQIRKKQSLYKKNINEIEQKLKSETIKINKDLFGDTKKIEKELITESKTDEFKSDVKQNEPAESDVIDSKYQFGDPDFFKTERKVINKNQTVVIDKDYEDLLLSEEQGFETDKLKWYMEFEDSRSLSISDVELKGSRLSPEEVVEELRLFFNYLFSNQIGNKINMNIELKHLMDAVLDGSRLTKENRTLLIEGFNEFEQFFERDDQEDSVINPTTQNNELNQEPDDIEEDNDVDYWEIYE